MASCSNDSCVNEKTENGVGKRRKCWLVAFSLNIYKRLFTSPDHEVLSVSYCDQFVVRLSRLSVRPFTIKKKNTTEIKLYGNDS